MKAHEKYGIEVGQKWTSADGAGHHMTILDVDTYADAGDVLYVSEKDGRTYRMNCFKLTYRYMRRN